MRFKSEKLPLLEVLQNLIGVVPTRTTLQVLTNFHISLVGDELSISATDLDIAMKTTLKVKGSEDGEMAVNARKFFEIIRELADGNVEAKSEDNVLIITSEKNFTFKIAGTDTNDFPQAPEVKPVAEFSVSSRMICKMVAKTSFAVSMDSARISLGGICWDIKDREMVMVATDGHRLGLCSFKHSLKIEGNHSVILSPKTLSTLCKICSEKDPGEISVSISSTYVIFSVGTTNITSKLIQGPYPNYEQVIPKGNNKKALIEKTDLVAAIRRASILSSGKTQQVKFSFSKDELELSSVNRDIGGESKGKIAISYSEENLDIGFNAGFFMEILKLVDTPRVQLSMNSSISACLFHPENEGREESYFFLLMPLRLLND